MIKTAILIDGAFYRKRSYYLFGSKSPKERADELELYCKRHIKEEHEAGGAVLYRVFYYDCPPSEKRYTILSRRRLLTSPRRMITPGQKNFLKN